MVLPQKIMSLQGSSKTRLQELRHSLEHSMTSLGIDENPPSVCIYATGSLARLEANPASDLDAFFLLSGTAKQEPLGRIRDVKILNAVILASEENSFPDFSNDGEYLNFLHVEEMLDKIGSREEDYRNMFTARMLLILESKYIFNEVMYEAIIEKVVSRYFTDFHKHSESFRPLFLLNDILRFWRTLCLNYEHGREWRTDDEAKRAKGHLANFKLRFSRCNMCFSFVARLLSIGNTVDTERVVQIIRESPIERLHSISEMYPNLKSLVESSINDYEWFLEAVSRDKESVLGWIGDKENRKGAFARADGFIQKIYEITWSIAESTGYKRYLVI